jgi:hypothetical protein
VEGVVSKNDGETPADGVNVMVTVGSNAPQTVQTDMDGMYSVTFFMPGTDVIASKDDAVSIVVTDATGGTHGPYQSVLTNEELMDDPATVTKNVTTAIPVPPRSVSILAVEGVVSKNDGETPADGVNVMVTVGSNAPQTVQTDMDGMYSVTFFMPGTDVIASKDDAVSIVVTDATGGTHGPYQSVLTNEELMDDPATVTKNVTTAIPVPPRSVSILAVEGVVSKNDGETPADGVNVMVTVGSNAPQTVQTDMDGMYSVTFFMPGTDVIASKDDAVSIVVTDATGGTHGPYQSVLTNEELMDDPATVTKNVTTAIPVPPRSVSILAVEGVVSKNDGETPADGVNVMVTVGSNAPQTVQTDMDGMYSVTFFMPGTDVIASSDILYAGD